MGEPLLSRETVLILRVSWGYPAILHLEIFFSNRDVLCEHSIQSTRHSTANCLYGFLNGRLRASNAPWYDDWWLDPSRSWGVADYSCCIRLEQCSKYLGKICVKVTCPRLHYRAWTVDLAWHCPRWKRDGASASPLRESHVTACDGRINTGNTSSCLARIAAIPPQRIEKSIQKYSWVAQGLLHTPMNMLFAYLQRLWQCSANTQNPGQKGFTHST